jgi:hypothetical protein
MDRLREAQQIGCGLPEVGGCLDTAGFRIIGRVKAKKQNVMIREDPGILKCETPFILSRFAPYFPPEQPS